MRLGEGLGAELGDVGVAHASGLLVRGDGRVQIGEGAGVGGFDGGEGVIEGLGVVGVLLLCIGSAGGSALVLLVPLFGEALVV